MNNSTNTCCPDCIGSWKDSDIDLGICRYINCPCHTNSTKKHNSEGCTPEGGTCYYCRDLKQRQRMIKAGNKVCSNCKRYLDLSEVDSTEVWQKEYRSLFNLYAYHPQSDYLLKDKIQTFITTLLAQQKREIVEMIKKRQNGWLGKEEDGSDRHEFYDELDVIIKKLTNNNN